MEKKKLIHKIRQKYFFFQPSIVEKVHKKKLTKTFRYLSKEKADYIFSQNSESIAWLFNMRGARSS